MDETKVQYASDTAGMAAMVDHLRETGVDTIRAELITDGEKQYYKVEYKVKEEAK